MEWVPDQKVLLEVSELLRNAQNTAPGVQQRLSEAVQMLMNLPEGVAILATVFANAQTESEETRQVAGLLLKNVMINSSAVKPAAAEYAKKVVLASLGDPSKVVRSTAGSIVTAILTKVGCDKWPEALATLNVETAPNIDIAATILETFKKIAEDELESMSYESNDTAFMLMSNQHFLPMLFRLANNDGVHDVLKTFALEILELYSSRHAFAKSEFADTYFPQFWDTLGRAALNPNPANKLAVVKSFSAVLEYDVEKIMENANIILEFFVTCSGDPDYYVRLAALNFWPEFIRESTAPRLLEPFAPRLVAILVEQTKYSDRDFADMEPGVTEDDNAEVPDFTNMAPWQRSRPEDPDDDEEEYAAWGNHWTVRKAAGLAIDTLAVYCPDSILPVCLQAIELKLNNTGSWEERESGVLILGAIAQGCLPKLDQFVPKVLELLVKLSSDKKPLLRSISCWCIGRYAGWYCRPENSPRYLETVVMALLVRMVDRNKGVQEAACSAVAVMEESAKDALIPFLPTMYECFAQCLRLYQTKNMALLFDAIGCLAMSVGSGIAEAHPASVTQVLFAPLFEKWSSLNPESYESGSCCECMLNLTHVLGPVVLPMSKVLVDQSLTFIEHQLLKIKTDKTHRSTAVVETCFDLLSAVCNAAGPQSAAIFHNTKILEIVTVCCTDSDVLQFAAVKQTLFAFIGDMSCNCLPFMAPILPQILPTLADQLLHQLWAVSSNASWALGQMVDGIDPEILKPHLNKILKNLFNVAEKESANPSLRQNACITIGRFGEKCPAEVGPLLAPIIRSWCEVMLPCTCAERIKALCGIMKAYIQAGNPNPQDSEILYQCGRRYVQSTQNKDNPAIKELENRKLASFPLTLLNPSVPVPLILYFLRFPVYSRLPTFF
ncbi:putative transportin [Gregarina niphandrodes]|uniref:Transportin n=1 Tax=Gregarina niphandrodes TaxID=110365 RepID=A0A023B9M1_GRENI|nr:putative transportin [Gregarina niphandrodes]EZG72991.1 putative transportin [Gregarina niphandrodes]|eukprot:XP_011129686.1 putative transportin [Gregarina niphandrodes]